MCTMFSETSPHTVRHSDGDNIMLPKIQARARRESDWLIDDISKALPITGPVMVLSNPTHSVAVGPTTSYVLWPCGHVDEVALDGGVWQ